MCSLGIARRSRSSARKQIEQTPKPFLKLLPYRILGDRDRV